MVVLTVIAICVLFILGVAGFAYSGLYDVGATAPHWPVTEWLFRTVRVNSIKRHAAGLQPPTDFQSDANLLHGVDHFAAHCAVCHGAPGVPRGDIAHGLYPQPPDLKDAAKQYTAGELFWILKHGIKMTGMPAWSDHSDAELWATVAFMQKLPTLTEQDYAKLIMQNMSRGSGPLHHGH
jgi:mono/diheme cytochrome c family protein